MLHSELICGANVNRLKSFFGGGLRASLQKFLGGSPSQRTSFDLNRVKNEVYRLLIRKLAEDFAGNDTLCSFDRNTQFQIPQPRTYGLRNLEFRVCGLAGLGD